MNVSALFEAELEERGLEWELDPESGRHSVRVGEATGLISLDNLQRTCEAEAEDGGEAAAIEAVVRFVDTIQAAMSEAWQEGGPPPLDPAGLFWALESNDYDEEPEFSQLISPRVSGVLEHISPDQRTVRFVTQALLDQMGLSEDAAFARASLNMKAILEATTVEFQEVKGVRLGFLNTTFPYKASLMLALELREKVEPVLGWPVLAVAPDRNFIYLWNGEEMDFAGELGGVVVREYQNAPYPLSTEVYLVGDEGVGALGEYPVEEVGELEE